MICDCLHFSTVYCCVCNRYHRHYEEMLIKLAVQLSFHSHRSGSISKKHFCPGGMAPSESMHSVRAVRDTPVVAYSAPGTNTMRRIASCPLITVHRFFSLCQYAIVNENSGVVANCDHTSEWVDWVHQQNVNRSGGHMQGSISSKHFVYHIRCCYSHKICYLMIWHALFEYL